MSKKINNMDIEQLLLTKTFSELNQQETNWILQEMTAEEYAHRRMVLINSKALFAQETAGFDPTMKAQLLDNITQQSSSSKPILLRALQYKLPLWQVAAGVAAVSLFFLWQPSHEQKQQVLPSPQIVHVYHTDTIYKEVEIPKSKKQPKKKFYTKTKITKTPKVKIENPIAMQTETELSINPTINSPSTFVDSSFSKTPIAVGRSVKDEAALMELLVELN